jgi:hypothetical protein
MPAKLSSLHNRLAKLEQEWAERVKREELADCNCPAMKSSVGFLAPIFPEALEAELNKTCPVHGFRQLGRIVRMNFGNQESTKVLQLIEEYKLRLAQHSQSSIEPEKEADDDSEEF